MTRSRRETTRLTVQVPSILLASLLALAGCTSTLEPTASHGASSPPAPSSSAATASPSARASSAESAAACPATRQTGLLPSDRLVDLAISSTATDDLLTFAFSPASAPGPAGPARGTLEAAEPPFSFAGSGQAIALLGRHAVQIRFSGMTIASETGEATYHGPTDAKPGLSTLREAIQYDASEGIVGWYVGYDGPGCVTLVRDGNDVTVTIAHGEAPAG